MTLEVRPNSINAEEIKRFRTFGATKIQIGVQHTSDDVLKYVNRQCYYADTVRAIRMLKDNGFKVDIHIMPNLPSSTPEKDIEMLEQIVNHPDLQADQWKIYPCEVLPYTKINEWYQDGTYIPYPESELKKVLAYALENVPVWVRINRVIRDFQMKDVIAGLQNSDLRDIVQREMLERGKVCQDIRTREVKTKAFDGDNIILVVRKYFASNGLEYFISHESKDGKTIYSLLRLRISSIFNTCVYPELQNVSFIREIHVYGKMIEHHEETTIDATQHKGLGKELIQKAIEITHDCGYEQIAVISGEGVKGYYKKMGFVETVGGYLVKQI